MSVDCKRLKAYALQWSGKFVDDNLDPIEPTFTRKKISSPATREAHKILSQCSSSPKYAAGYEKLMQLDLLDDYAFQEYRRNRSSRTNTTNSVAGSKHSEYMVPEANGSVSLQNPVIFGNSQVNFDNYTMSSNLLTVDNNDLDAGPRLNFQRSSFSDKLLNLPVISQNLEQCSSNLGIPSSTRLSNFASLESPLEEYNKVLIPETVPHSSSVKYLTPISRRGFSGSRQKDQDLDTNKTHIALAQSEEQVPSSKMLEPNARESLSKQAANSKLNPADNTLKTKRESQTQPRDSISKRRSSDMRQNSYIMGDILVRTDISTADDISSRRQSRINALDLNRKSIKKTILDSLIQSKRASMNLSGTDANTFSIFVPITALARRKSSYEGSQSSSTDEITRIHAVPGSAFITDVNITEGTPKTLQGFLSRRLKNRIERGWEYEYKRPKHFTFITFLQRKEKYFIGHLISEMRSIFQIPPHDRTREEINELQKWCSTMKGFRKYPPEVQKLLLRSLGRTIVREGHPASLFYIILDGEIEISVVDKAALEATKTGKKVLDVNQGTRDEKEETQVKESDLKRAYVRNLGLLHSGDSFGDSAFRGNGFRSASIRTTRASEFLLIDKQDFERIMNSPFAISHFNKDKQRIEDLKKEFSLLRTLKLDNAPISLFDFRIFPPNFAIVTEGDKEDCIWFIKSGKLRLLKILRFEERKMPDGSVKLIMLPDVEQELKKGQDIRKGQDLKKGQDIRKGPERKIIVKLIKIKELGPGDYLGNHRGLLHYSNETNADPDVERDLRSSQSPSQVTVITNTRAEMVGLTRFEFHKISTEATSKLLDFHSEFRVDVDEIGDSFMENRRWDRYRNAIFKIAIGDAKVNRHRNVAAPFSETRRI